MATLQQIIDRRLSGKNKSIGNRERFLRRYREPVVPAVLFDGLRTLRCRFEGLSLSQRRTLCQGSGSLQYLIPCYLGQACRGEMTEM